MARKSAIRLLDKTMKNPDLPHTDRLAALMRELSSPKSVSAAVRLLEQIKREWMEAYAVYHMAVARHGRTELPPESPSTSENTHKTERASNHETRSLTMAGLVDRYRNDPRYSRLRYRSRQNYESLIRRVLEDCGNERLADLKAQDIERHYKVWTERGRVMARALITMLRMLFGFGTTVLEDSDCQRLSIIMNKMRFKKTDSRAEYLTLEQVKAIISQAHKTGRPSIALAQAIQFDCGLRQRDVIGEWVPHSEPGVTDLMDGPQKWLRGIRWSEIDKDLVLRHVTSRSGALEVVKLSDKPLVRAELDRMTKLPTSGPIIVSEESNLPYHSDTFRKLWRKIAITVGIPKHVKNMDARLGKQRSSEDEEDSENERATDGDASVARQ